MDQSNVRSFAYIADDYVDTIKAVVVNFPGLGSNEMRSSLDVQELKWAQNGVLSVYPFVNPWNWMNDKTVRFVDELLEIVYNKFSLANCPLIARGGSMGGYSALAYPMFSRLPVKASIAVAPVCDFVFHYSERCDLPRTMHDTFDTYGDISDILVQRSPVHQVSKMPDIEYLIIHGVKDTVVNKAPHSDKLVELMRKNGKNVIYIEDCRMEHCWPYSWESVEAIDNFIEKFV